MAPTAPTPTVILWVRIPLALRKRLDARAKRYRANLTQTVAEVLDTGLRSAEPARRGPK